MRALLVLFAAMPALNAAPPAGIPRALARERAALVSGVRYQLSFTLRPAAPTVPGEAKIAFTLKRAAPLLLDYREGTLRSVTVNGTAATPALVNGHIQLPGGRLRAGENTVAVVFESAVAPAGKAFIRYVDRDDHTEYVYTLFVPMDASMAFPCFDQPDIKGRFTLKVDAPQEWTVVSNAPEVAPHSFAETAPISTYLFALAAGPFRKIGPSAAMTTLWVRQSQVKRAEQESQEVLTTTDRGVAFLSEYFDRRFPFPKYDLVLLPGFAFGGMEHAGATFLREETVLFRSQPTASDRMNRARLLLHETTHQWFGDLVTMRWFDDLWLKEGFANYMAYRSLETLSPASLTWKRFSETIRPAAYGIDVTKGTTPIYQEIGNLNDAKSAYGAIVYSKAPAVLRQLAFLIGDNAFRDGLRLYLKEHAYANAEWSDLVNAFERASGRKLGRFAETWIRRRGMPRVTVDWACDAGRISRFTLSQADVLGEGGLWPLDTQVLLHYPDREPVRVRASLEGASAPVASAVSKPCPDWVFTNDEDHGYGLFLLDDRSLRAVVPQLGSITDPFLRSMLWSALWDTVRDGRMPAADYLAAAHRLMGSESDESLLETTLPRVVTALHRYLPGRGDWPGRFEALSSDRMRKAPSLDQRITWYRFFRAIAETPPALEQLEAVLDGKLAIPGVAMRPLDRWRMVTALLAHDAPDAGKRLEAERKRDDTGEGRKYAWIAEAARPDPAVKRRYFDDYLHQASLPEDWVEQSLEAFNSWNQSAVTLPYLKPALGALPQMKEQRRIFFVLAWLNAFIGGQSGPEALDTVRQFLGAPAVTPDLRLKILQVNDELERAVRLRTAK